MMRQIQEVEVIKKLAEIHKKVSTLSSFHINGFKIKECHVYIKD